MIPLTPYDLLSVVTFFQVWKYCNLLVEDAVFSQPYFYSDSAMVEYLLAKICGERLIDAVKFRSWLMTKRSSTKEAKSRGKLLGKKYRCLMQNCIHNWTSLFFNPNIQSVLYAGKQKFFWMQSKFAFANLWKQIEGYEENETIFGMERVLRSACLSFSLCLSPFVFVLDSCLLKNLRRNSKVFLNFDLSGRSPTALRQFTEDYLKNVESACSALTQWHKTLHPKSNDS